MKTHDTASAELLQDASSVKHDDDDDNNEVVVDAAEATVVTTTWAPFAHLPTKCTFLTSAHIIV